MAFCPACGASVTAEAQRCDRCGAELKRAAPSTSKFKGTMIMSAAQPRPSKPPGAAPPPAGSVPPPAGSVPPPATSPHGATSAHGPSPSAAMPAIAPGHRFKGTIMMGAAAARPAPAATHDVPASQAGETARVGTEVRPMPAQVGASPRLALTDEFPLRDPRDVRPGDAAKRLGHQPLGEATGPALWADARFPGDLPGARAARTRTYAIGLAIVVGLALTTLWLLRS